MTTFNTLGARVALAFIDAHPELPELCSVTHDSDAHGERHDLHVAGTKATIAHLLAWHDVLDDTRIEMRDYRDEYVLFHVFGKLPTGQRIKVYGGSYHAERDLLVTKLGLYDGWRSVDVDVLRRLSNARVAEAVA